MSGDLAERAVALAVELGLIEAGTPAEVTPLTGGVSSDIALVSAGERRFCVKFALEQLRVKEVWKAPATRYRADYDWLAYVSAIAPTAVPELYGRSDALGGFAMAFLDPEKHPNWKTEMLAGTADVAFAEAVGALLGAIHAHAARDAAGRGRFANQSDFFALRLDPYLAFTASRHPDLAPQIDAVIAEQRDARISLVHGDVSPKNILKGPDGPVLLDAECAVEGDPAFDVGFCLNHLVIKALAATAPPGELAASAEALWGAYRAAIDWEEPAALERRLCRLLPVLMLARVDGKSPVEYLDEDQRGRLRALARELVAEPPAHAGQVFARARAVGEGGA